MPLSASNPPQHMQIKSKLRAPFTSHKRQTEWKREGTGERGRKVDEWGGNLGNWVSEKSECWWQRRRESAASTGELMNRAVPPFIYFPVFAAWDSSEPFLFLFRGSLRCNIAAFCLPGFRLRRSRRKKRGGLTFASAVTMVLEITSPVPTLSPPLQQKPAVQTVCFYE